MSCHYHSGNRTTNVFRLLLIVWLWVLAWLFVQPRSVDAIDSGGPQNSPLATAQVRLLMEQVDQLADAQQFEEAFQVLAKLFDESDGLLVEHGPLQKAATQSIERLIPVRHWVRTRTKQLLHQSPEAWRIYRDTYDEPAAASLKVVGKTHDLLAAEIMAQQFSSTTSGPAAHLLVADLYLDRGWSIAAKQAVQHALPEGNPWLVSLASPRLTLPLNSVGHSQQQTEQVPARTEPENRLVPDAIDPLGSDGISWPTVWQQLEDLQRRALVKRWVNELAGRRTAERIASQFEQDLGACVIRLVHASAFEISSVDFAATCQWAEAVSQLLSEAVAVDIRSNIGQAQQWFDARQSESTVNHLEVKSFGGGQDRNHHFSSAIDINAWPNWRQRVDRITANLDRNSAGKPRVGESELGTLPYHPIVHQGRVFVNHMRSIFALDLKTGKNWPTTTPALPLYDSGVSTEAFVPLGYPMVGVPRGTLTIANDCLYARMGPPVTGWANREANAETGSFGYLIGLDIRRQGRMLPGFPLHLNGPGFAYCEPEGCPIVLGENLLVAIVQRDNVGLRRFVAAFDRISGQFRWRSRTLGSGAVEGSQQANLISHQLLSAGGGRVYYSTNLGTVACLDPVSGRVEWMARYRRQSINDQFPGSSQRFRYRDLTPCLIAGNLVYCAPQDCPEMFALDIATGNLVWSSSVDATADVVHLLGVSDSSVIASGDRLLWIDRISGRLQARFPATTTAGALNSLPSPRGIGRGIISANLVYWPTARELFAFPAVLQMADQHSDSPPMRKRIRLDVRDAEGGNLLVADGWFLIAGPSRLNAFAQPVNKPVSTQSKSGAP